LKLFLAWPETTSGKVPIGENARLAESPSSTSSAGPEACYTSFLEDMRRAQDPQHLVTDSTTHFMTTSTLVYETLQSFGPGTEYTDCDGIPRFRFTGPKTITSSSSVSVTVTFDLSRIRAYYVPPKSRPKPTCSLGRQQCERLWAAMFTEGSLPAPVRNCPVRWDCQLDIEEVVIIYWPDEIASRDICAQDGYGSAHVLPRDPKQAGVETTYMTNAISFRGQDLYLRSVNGEASYDHFRQEANLPWAYGRGEGVMVSQTAKYVVPSVMRGQFVFTYPTVYLAHREITADIFRETYSLPSSGGELRTLNVSNTITTFRPAGIIPLKPEDIQSIRRVIPNNGTGGGLQYAQMVAKGEFRPVITEKIGARPEYETRPFDFEHLRDPVPARVYYDARSEDCWGSQSHCSTITDDSYRPRLIIASRVWEDILPGGFLCRDPLVVDPPIALHPIDINQLPDSEPPLTDIDQPTASQKDPYPGSSLAFDSPKATGTAAGKAAKSGATSSFSALNGLFNRHWPAALVLLSPFFFYQ
jgi:hypothetical protein